MHEIQESPLVSEATSSHSSPLWRSPFCSLTCILPAPLSIYTGLLNLQALAEDPVHLLVISDAVQPAEPLPLVFCLVEASFPPLHRLEGKDTTFSWSSGMPKHPSSARTESCHHSQELGLNWGLWCARCICSSGRDRALWHITTVLKHICAVLSLQSPSVWTEHLYLLAASQLYSLKRNNRSEEKNVCAIKIMMFQ